MSCLAPQLEALEQIEPRQVSGTVAAVRGLSLIVDDLPVPVGTLILLHTASGGRGGRAVRGEVIGFEAGRSIVMLLDSSEGIRPGARAIAEQTAQTVAVSSSLLGRVIDGLARPIDGRAAPSDGVARLLWPAPTAALRRRAIHEPLPTGVRAVDALATVGKGQRLGIFSGPGVGKSTLLATIARHTEADINVIALVGERGREVRAFIDDVLGEEGLRRSVVIVATGDESPLLRVRAAMVAATVAEHFRDQGADVLLMMDSITRFAQAQRQIGLTVGEQPATKGYTPSVFAMLPRLLERAGPIEGAGSITGLYAVLVEGDDLSEPISDAVRGILDGHLALSRRLASRGHFPAIDLLESVSRVADDVCDANHVEARRRVLRLLSAHAEAEELINIGAYAHGSNRACDVAIAMKHELDGFLQQSSSDVASYPSSCRRLIELGTRAEALETAPNAPTVG